MEAALNLEQPDHVFAFDQADRTADDAEGDKIILGLSLGDDLKDIAGGLIEGFDSGEDVAAGQCLSLAEDGFGAVLIDIESENLAAEFAVHDDAACASGGAPPRNLPFSLALGCFGAVPAKQN